MDKMIYSFESCWSQFDSVFGTKGKFESEFALPRRWDGKDIYIDLDGLLKKYYSVASEFCDDILSRCILEVCTKVRTMLRLYLHGYPADAYIIMKRLMQKLDEEPLYRNNREIESLYRMSSVPENIDDKPRIFHAPYNIRPKIRNYRYSIAGYPSLYLAESLALAEEEMHLFRDKKTAIAARFVLDSDSFSVKRNKILEFGFRPQDLASTICDYHNSTKGETAAKKKDTSAFRYSFEASISGKVQEEDPSVPLHPLQEVFESEGSEKKGVFCAPEVYMLWYPLIAACSYVRTNREDPFAPEYIIPQLLTQWMRSENTGVLVGIRYFSCYSRKASEVGCNYVFPSSGDPIILKDGIRLYCPVLNEAFKFTGTEYLPEYKSLDELKVALDRKQPERAFRLTREDYKGERKVELPSQLIYIAAKSFMDCKFLETIKFTDSVVSIGNSAFSGCENLSLSKLPEGLKQIGECAFLNCSKLTNISIPASVDSIGILAFAGCKNLRTITVDKDNENYKAINGMIIDKRNSSIISVVPMTRIKRIPKYIKQIGDWAFSGNRNLESIELSTSLIRIGNEAFSGCYNLSLDEIPSSVTEIGDSAFYWCKKLALKKLPAKISEIGSSAFYGCANLSLQELPPDLTCINKSSFAYCTNLELSELPAGVTRIRFSAFEGCEKLKLSTLPESLTHIGPYAFQNCTNLALTELPQGLKRIQPYAFRNCTNLALTKLPQGLTCIEYSAFEGCTHLALKSLPDSVKSIDGYAFSGCHFMPLRELPRGLLRIDTCGFSGCHMLDITSFPDSLESIGEQAFFGCINLTISKLPSSLRIIEERAFLHCEGLKEIVLPVGIEQIGKGAFADCVNLTSIEISSDNKNYKNSNNVIVDLRTNSLIACPGSAKTAIIPPDIEMIEDLAFSGCTKLSCVELPTGVKSIGMEAFFSCISLSEITIPSSIESFGRGIFSYCNSLQVLHYSGTQDQWSKISKHPKWADFTPEFTVCFVDSQTMTKSALLAFERQADS